MDYKSDIETGLREALKNRDGIRVSIFRMLLTSIKNKEVEKMRPLTEEEFFALIRQSIRQHQESIDGFRKGGRMDLVEKEERELEILKEFLPLPLSEEELLKNVVEAIALLEAKTKKDAGKVIKFLMDKFPGRIEGKVLSEMVLERLSTQ